MTLSLAITTYNRTELTIRSFERVLNDPRISEIVIVDDASDEQRYEELRELIDQLNSNKVIMYRNDINLGMSLNKFMAISRCNNSWVIIFDSDNVLDTNYLDAFESYSESIITLNHSTIFCPSGALPKFDYSSLSDITIDKNNVRLLLSETYGIITEWTLNTCNYIVHKGTYVRNYEYNREMKGTDTIWHNYNHLKNKGSLHIVPNMTYQHLVWDGSGWRKDRAYNKNKAMEVKKLIEQL